MAGQAGLRIKAVLAYRNYLCHITTSFRSNCLQDRSNRSGSGFGDRGLFSDHVHPFRHTYRGLWVRSRTPRALADDVRLHHGGPPIYQLAGALPAPPNFPRDDAYDMVLGQVPRILLAGWIAVFAGDIANNYVMAKLDFPHFRQEFLASA